MTDVIVYSTVLRRVLLVAGLVATGAALKWGGAVSAGALRRGEATFDDLVVLTAAGAAWVCLIWFGVAVLCVAAGTAPGGIGRFGTWAADRIVPGLARRLAGSALGFAVATGTTASLVAPAAATTPAAAVSAIDAGRVTSDGEFDHLPPIGRPAVEPPEPGHRRPAHTGAEPGPKPADRAQRTVVVSAGDSLWSIAADHLPPSASAERVAKEWPRWFAANRDELGADPDLIHPGVELRRPPALPPFEGAPR